MHDAAYQDRIVHHAIHETLSPFYENFFINDSYACRAGCGIHNATKKVQSFMRHDQDLYACQIDISKFYPSINHSKLYDILNRRIDDKLLLNLLKIIIDSTDSGHTYDYLFAPDSNFFTHGRHGLPIGNLTSQLFANIYLNEVDQYAKQKLKIRQYVRYMDDVVFFHQDKDVLQELQRKINDFLYDELYLTINPRKVRIYPARQGITFVGYKIFPSYLLLRGSSVRRFKKHYRHQLNAVASDYLPRETMQTAFDSWKAHAAHASTERLVQNLELWQDHYLKPKKFTQTSFFDNDLF